MIRLDIEAWVHNKLIPELCVVKNDPEGGYALLDKKHQGKGAKVRRIVAETIGIEGSYSSLRLGIEIEIECKPDQDSVQAASQAMFTEALAVIDDEVKQAEAVLRAHIEAVNDG